MAVSLISFLGRGPYSADLKRRDYFKTRYQFSDWTSHEVSFFLHAVLTWLREQRHQPPDRVIVLGTPGSMWDNLLLTFCPHLEEHETVWQEVARQVDQQTLGEQDVAVVGKLVSQGLGVEVHAELIPPGKTVQEQAHILAALQGHVTKGDHVYFDVTNGYRHQPMLGLGAAILLTYVRDAHIEEIFYGASEMREANAAAPVVSLRWLLDLIAWAGSIEQLRSGGRLRALTQVVQDPSLQKMLGSASFLLATNQVHRAGEEARHCLDRLAAVPADPILQLTCPAIQEALEAIAGCQRDAHGIVTVARDALRQQDYVRASILLCEAVTKYETTSGVALDPARVAGIKHLRNALAHAAGGNRADVREALLHRKKLEAMLREQLDWLDCQFSMAPTRTIPA